MAIETTPSAPADVAAVRRIEELTHDDIPYGGGKGANLGELTRAGFPVPTGFVVGATFPFIVWGTDELRRWVVRCRG